MKRIFLLVVFVFVVTTSLLLASTAASAAPRDCAHGTERPLVLSGTGGPGGPLNYCILIRP